ncbi:MAG TPA: hypothetical protein VFW24_09365 [Acidimicrobiales bacterium]|nr:hypothetical protein [Acidimicrobiales bacterium]
MDGAFGPTTPSFESSGRPPGGGDESMGTLENPADRRRRAWPLAIGVVIVVVGVGIGLIVASGGSTNPGAGIAPAAFVLSASQTTLTERTADLVLAGTVSTAGKGIPLNGTGEAALSNPQQFAATVDFTGPGGTIEQKEVVADGRFFMGIESHGQDISALVPGKHWVEIPIPVGTGSSLGTGTSDPLAQLHLLAAKGNTVTTLGTKSIRGTTASGYAVTISRQNLLDAEQKYLSSSGIDPGTQQQIAQAAQSLQPLTMDVWFDASKLLRRMSFSLDTTQNGRDVAVNLDMDFVNYGAHVSISTPSADDVVSLNQFEAAVKAHSESGG